MYYKRTIESRITKNLFTGSVISIYGARQVGKTTLVKEILSKYSQIESRYLNCDERDVQVGLSEAETSVSLKEFVGEAKLVVLDEAQRVKDIGLKLKLLIDNFPETQIIATGSSSFELSNKISEPLTGRNLEYWLYPLSLKEISFPNKLTSDRYLEQLLIYGSYPKVFSSQGIQKRTQTLNEIVSSYLYKDILKFKNIKNQKKSKSFWKLLHYK